MNEMAISTKQLQKKEDLELVPVKIERILINPYNETFVVMSADGKYFGIELTNIEGTMLSFIKSECFLQSYEPNIYTMHTNMMKKTGLTLESGVFEKVDGDMLYGKLIWKKEKIKYFEPCSDGNVIIFATMYETPMYIVRKALNLVDEIDSDFEEPDIEFE